MRYSSIITATLLIASSLVAQDANIQSVTPADPATAASTNTRPVDAKTVELLNKIEKACMQLQSYQADMKYDIIQSLTDSQSIRTGQLYYKVDDKSILARMHFADLTEIDLMDTESLPAVTKFNEDYYFDGLWVVRTSQQTKTVQKWEVSKDRQNRDAFRIGHGPFPLPFAIKTGDVTEYFDVKLDAPPQRTKPENAISLTLTPMPGSSYAKEYKLVELWVNKDNFMPIQICYVKQDYEENTVTWTNIKTNEKIENSMFTMPSTPAGWTEEIKKLEEKE